MPAASRYCLSPLPPRRQGRRSQRASRLTSPSRVPPSAMVTARSVNTRGWWPVRTASETCETCDVCNAGTDSGLARLRKDSGQKPDPARARAVPPLGYTRSRLARPPATPMLYVCCTVTS